MVEDEPCERIRFPDAVVNRAMDLLADDIEVDDESLGMLVVQWLGSELREEALDNN